MLIGHRLKTTLLTAVLLSGASLLHAQQQMCRDSVEHKRLQKAMWDACGQDDKQKVYDACKAYQAHASQEDDLDAYYNAWVCGIVYNLDHMNIYDAYHITQTMKEDLLHGRGGKDEQFLAPNMLGQVYNACGNISGAISEFKKAVELIKGTKYEATGLGTLYLGMAHIYINSKLEKSMHWIDEDIKEAKRHPELPRYYRNLANAHAFKAMLYFKLRQIDQFWACQRLARDYESKNQSGSSGSFMPYLDIYEKALNGQMPEALEAIQKIPNQKDRYILRCDIFRHIGDDDKAFNAQRKLMHIRDSITGLMIAENIENMEEEMALLKGKQAATVRTVIILVIAVILALLLSIALLANIINRRKYQKDLLEKNRQLSDANEKVTAADRMKTEFIRNVSHEIRTPLNIINGFSQVITASGTALDEQERQQIASTIEENTQHITSLVNKMLALADEDTKNILEGVTDTDYRSVCHQAIADMPKTDPTRVKVGLQIADDTPATIQTNGSSLKRMLDCLLENAVKFTEQGHITLCCREADGTKMQFIVEDTGCGISPEDAQHIFERFTKIDNFKEGLGLGLAYCRETAQKLGGSLTLDPDYHGGCRFTLTLPIKQQKS